MNDTPRRFPAVAWLSLASFVAVILLIGFHKYLDGWNPHREFGQHPKDDVERLVLKIAAWTAGIGSVAGIVACTFCLAKPAERKGGWWSALLVLVNAVLCFGLILAEQLKGFTEGLPT